MDCKMARNRILWLLLTAAAAAAYVFENQTGTRVMLVLLLLLPLVSAAMLWMPRGKISAEIECPESISRGSEGRMCLRLRNSGRITADVRGELVLRNRMTGEEQSFPVSAAVPGRGERTCSLALLTPHCGRMEIRLQKLRKEDVLRLFRKKACEDLCFGVTVLPRVRPMEVFLAETADFLSDSQQYSANRPGYDPSETFRIREYAPGDPLRQIHWKLSEKLDQLQVRDFGLPIVERMLLLVETGVLPGNRPNADRNDSVLDLLASVSVSLSLQGISHVIGWEDAESGDYISREIHAEEDLEPALSELLCSPLTVRETTVCACFNRTHVRCVFAHVAVFSGSAAPDLNLLFHGNRVTALLPDEAARENETWTLGAELTAFTNETTELEL